MTEREIKIEYYMAHLADAIPYSDPNYKEELLKLATSIVDNEDQMWKDYEEYCKDLPEDFISHTEYDETSFDFLPF